MTQAPSPAEAPQAAALSRELSEFLIELSIGAHRFAMYPAGHPSLDPAVEKVWGRLGALLRDRSTLSIGVARDQLVIEGVATDRKHPVLRDLARRLHDEHLGAVSFDRGADAREIEGLLETLAAASRKDEEPLGLQPEDRRPRWTNVRIYGVGYDKLELRGEGDTGDGKAASLWLGLARAALDRDGAVGPDEAPDAPLLARVIADHRRDAAYDQVIVGYLLQLAEQLKDGGAEDESVRRHLSRLIEELDESTLSRLVEMGGSLGQRRRFVLDANESLAADAVLKVLRSAADASSQTISTSFARLLTKLATHAEKGPPRMRSQADAALRQNVEELIADWELRDPNPDAYTRTLDALARAAPVFQARSPGEEESLAGAERVIRMALEVDAFGPTVTAAMQDLVEAGGAGRLLELAESAPEGNALAERLRRHLTSPDQLRALLGAEEVDETTLGAVVQRMGSAALDPLLDVLAESDSRSVRRMVFDQLAGMGPFVGRRAAEILRDDERWFVQRNMLALLLRLEAVPEDFDPMPFLVHADARVRREALPLALERARSRERVLVAALSDPDERMVRMALLALQDGAPEAVVPTLVNRVVNADRSGDLKALAARALRASGSRLALNALLDLASGGRSFLGRERLAEKSPEMLAALESLWKRWPGDDRASALLDLAGRARDPEVQAAARGGSR